MPSETCFLDPWDKDGPHGAYPLPLSENGFSILLLQTPLISGVPHLLVWVPRKVAQCLRQRRLQPRKFFSSLPWKRAARREKLFLLFFFFGVITFQSLLPLSLPHTAQHNNTLNNIQADLPLPPQTTTRGLA